MGVPLGITTRSNFSDIYLIANAVDGLPSGSYFFDRENESLELLKLRIFPERFHLLVLGAVFVWGC